MDEIYLGMRHDDQWGESEREYSWNEAVLYLFPNGSAPLTAMMSQMDVATIDDPWHHWYIQKMAERGGEHTGIYTNDTLTTAYTGSTLATAGTILFIKMGATIAAGKANVKDFVVNTTVMLFSTTDPYVRLTGLVTKAVQNGDRSYIRVKLTSNDVTTSLGNNAAVANKVFVMGSAFGEGTGPGTPINRVPTLHDNKAEIFKTEISITGTAAVTRLRTGNAKEKNAKEKLLEHATDREKSCFFGRLYEDIDPEKKTPRRFMGGLVEFIEKYASANVLDYRYDVDFKGQDWLTGGEEFFDKVMDQVSFYGTEMMSDEWMFYCNNATLNGFNSLARSRNNIQITTGEIAYGISVIRWVTPYGTIYLKRHPLFNVMYGRTPFGVLLQPQMVSLKATEGRDMLERDISDADDAEKKELLSEITIEVEHPESMAVVTGIGKDNNLEE